MKKCLMAALALLASLQATAATLPINDQTQVVLGSGVEPITGERKEQCIEYDEKDIKFMDGDDIRRGSGPVDPDEMPGVGQGVSTKVVTSNTEAFNFLNIEVSAQASYLAYSGGGSYSQTEKSFHRTDRMSVGLSAAQDYGRREITRFKLKPKYARMAAKADKTEFYKNCGREFVVGYRLGQGLKILLTSSNDLSESYSRIHAAAKGSAQVGAFGGSASASFEKMAQEMMKFGSLEVVYKGFGTGPIKTLSVFLNSEADVKKFGDTVAKFANDLDSSTAVKTHYITRPYEETIAEYDSIAIEARRKRIQSLYGSYVQIQDDYERVLRINQHSIPGQLSRLCNLEGQLSCREYLRLLDDRKRALEKAQENAVAHIRTCVTNEDVNQCKGLSIDELYPDLTSQVLWPKQYKKVLLDAFLKQHVNRRE